MSDNIVSFEEYLKKKNKQVAIDKSFFEKLSEEIRSNPDLLEWINFQNLFNKHKLFLNSLYTANHVSGDKNPNSGYFIAFEEEVVNHHIDKIKEANKWLGRNSIFVDAKNCVYRKIVEQITGELPKSNSEAYGVIKSVLHDTNNVLVIANISKSKLPSNKSAWARSIIKINDDAHFNGIKPDSDILFVDNAVFLERSWKQMGIYLEIFA